MFFFPPNFLFPARSEESKLRPSPRLPVTATAKQVETARRPSHSVWNELKSPEVKRPMESLEASRGLLVGLWLAHKEETGRSVYRKQLQTAVVGRQDLKLTVVNVTVREPENPLPLPFSLSLYLKPSLCFHSIKAVHQLHQFSAQRGIGYGRERDSWLSSESEDASGWRFRERRQGWKRRSRGEEQHIVAQQLLLVVVLRGRWWGGAVDFVAGPHVRGGQHRRVYSVDVRQQLPQAPVGLRR